VKAAAPPELVYRIGRRPDPWAWPDWSFAGSDGTFGNRFDDPSGIYRVLYASSQRVATFVECLAYFRPDPAILAAYEQIGGCDDDSAEPTNAGVVPHEWIAQRLIGTGRLRGTYVELGHHDTLGALRAALLPRVVHYGLADLDAAAVRLTLPRSFTQEISRFLFEQTEAGQRQWDGINYQSRHGDDFENWAIFEPAAPARQSSTSLEAGDADLATALTLHGLRLG
jgi:RES domain